MVKLKREKWPCPSVMMQLFLSAQAWQKLRGRATNVGRWKTLPELRAGGLLLSATGGVSATLVPRVVTLSLCYRGRLSPALRCQSQADHQHFVQLPPALWPHDRWQYDLCGKPSEAWTRHLPGQRPQAALEDQGWQDTMLGIEIPLELLGAKVRRLSTSKLKHKQGSSQDDSAQ
jgi:hypothetical protein